MNYNIIKEFVFLLLIKNILLSFLPTGINQFNNLIYLQRLTYDIFQTNINKCSLSDGPFCYYFEPSYIKALSKEQQTLKKDFLEKDWITLVDNLNVYTIQETYDELTDKISKYIQRILNNDEQEQKLPTQEYSLDITFDNYDYLTIKNDVYLEKKLLLPFQNDKLTVIIDGKIRLKYDKSETKVIISNLIDYPSNTYAVIESNRIVITMGGKNFKCVSFYVRPKSLYDNEKYKVTIIGTISRNLAIEGYNNNKLVFSSNYKYAYFDEKQWTKVILNNDLFINKLIIPGNIEIDNLSFSVENNNVYDIESLFYNDPKRKTMDLISDNDI